MCFEIYTHRIIYDGNILKTETYNNYILFTITMYVMRLQKRKINV